MWDHRPTLDFGFLSHLPPPFRLTATSTSTSTTDPLLQPQPSTQASSFSNLHKLLTMSLVSVLPLRPAPPPRSPRRRDPLDSGCALPRFRPYVAKIPWHGGARAFLSKLFPRYGHYCGPNWSSGKEGGTMLWDRRPIDWLDFCCYCHDIGYDTHDQAKLLKADLAFLDCLERPRMATKGGAHLALLYRSMYIAGLRNLLIPYRMQLLRMQSGPSIVDLLGGLISRGNTFRQNSDRKKHLV